MKLVDLTGQRFGRLVVLERAPSHVTYTMQPYGGSTYECKTMWHVRCDCGREKDVEAQSLRRGATRSCGCLRSRLVKERNRGRGERIATSGSALHAMTGEENA